MSSELVKRKLSDFYNKYAPEKIDTIDATFDQWRLVLPQLFESLVEKYHADADFFVDVTELAAARPTLSSQSALHEEALAVDALPMEFTTVTRSEVEILLRHGEMLLKNAPKPPNLTTPDRHPQLQTDDDLLIVGGADGKRADLPNMKESQSPGRMRDDRDNVTVEQQKAEMAEQQALQERLEKLRSICEERLQATKSRELITVVVVENEAKIHHFPTDHTFTYYLQEGIASIPYRRSEPTCTVTTSSTESPATASVTVAKVALAMGMRVWTAGNPHMVSSRVEESWKFIEGATFWRMWPEPVVVCSRVRLEADEAAGQVATDSASAAAHAGKDDHRKQQGRHKGYWDFFMDEWSTLETQMRLTELKGR